jgi:hypothetical protein
MRNFEEIKKNPSLRNIEPYPSGIHCEIHVGGWDGSVIATTNCGWNHVSVAPYAKRIIPDWDAMCKIKDIFFEDEEAVIQVHPKKSEYVNNMTNCLHLWQCKYTDMVLPPSCLVGVKDGMTKAELDRELREAYEMAGEKYPY